MHWISSGSATKVPVTETASALAEPNHILERSFTDPEAVGSDASVPSIAEDSDSTVPGTRVSQGTPGCQAPRR